MGAFTCLKDYYKVLEVDYDASEEKIRLNYRRLALVGHLSFVIVPWIVFLIARVRTIKCNGIWTEEIYMILWAIYRSGILTSTRMTVLLLQSSKR